MAVDRNKIDEQAVEPRTAQVDGVATGQRDLREVIAWDKHTTANPPADEGPQPSNPIRNLRFAIGIPPGAQGSR